MAPTQDEINKLFFFSLLHKNGNLSLRFEVRETHQKRSSFSTSTRYKIALEEDINKKEAKGKTIRIYSNKRKQKIIKKSLRIEKITRAMRIVPTTMRKTLHQ